MPDPGSARDRAGKLALSGWIRQGRALTKGRSEVQWQLADWLAAGYEQWGRQALAAAESDLQISQARSYDYLLAATTYPDSCRQESVSFEHHIVAARAGAPECHELLAEAAARCWTKQQLAEAVRARRRGPLPREATVTHRLREARRAAMHEIRQVRTLVRGLSQTDLSQWDPPVRRRVADELEGAYTRLADSLGQLREPLELILDVLRRPPGGGPHGAA